MIWSNIDDKIKGKFGWERLKSLNNWQTTNTCLVKSSSQKIIIMGICIMHDLMKRPPLLCASQSLPNPHLPFFSFFTWKGRSWLEGAYILCHCYLILKDWGDANYNGIPCRLWKAQLLYNWINWIIH